MQRRTVVTLMGSQTFGGVGMAAGIAVSAIAAAELSGSDALSGLATTAQVLGGALFTVPVAALMARRGRRPGLVTAYLIGALGAVLAIGALVSGWFWMLLVGTTLFGAATTGNSQARYAATDLAPPSRRGRHLAWVVWATTLGSVLGPNLVGPGRHLADLLGLPDLAGVWLLSTAGFLLAALVLAVALRPDPLLLSRRLAGEERHSARPSTGVAEGLRVLAARPLARWGALSVAGGHVVMVAVMVMTPLHMTHGGAAIEAVGLVISLHILGMYALSPLTGWATDRLGSRAVVAGGAVLLLAATVLAALSPAGESTVLTLGLVLLGLGWSCTMVAGSQAVVSAVPVGARAGAQGAADLVMGLSAAAGGALAGLVMDAFGFAALAVGAGGIAVALAASTIRRRGGLA